MKCNASVVERHKKSDYCRDDHDPNFVRSTSTDIFRIDGLTNDMSEVVTEYRSGKDVYSMSEIASISGKQLDHVQELQTFRDTFDLITPAGERGHEGATILKNKIKLASNICGNLNYTSRDINLLKFDAVYKYQQDYKEGRVNAAGLTYYLLDASVKDSGVKLSREITFRIKDSMATAYDAVVESLEQENVYVETFVDKFHDMTITNMKLT